MFGRSAKLIFSTATGDSVAAKGAFADWSVEFCRGLCGIRCKRKVPGLCCGSHRSLNAEIQPHCSQGPFVLFLFPAASSRFDHISMR